MPDAADHGYELAESDRAEIIRLRTELAEIRVAADCDGEPHPRLLDELRRLVAVDDESTTLRVQHQQRGELLVEARAEIARLSTELLTTQQLLAAAERQRDAWRSVVAAATVLVHTPTADKAAVETAGLRLAETLAACEGAAAAPADCSCAWVSARHQAPHRPDLDCPTDPTGAAADEPATTEPVRFLTEHEMQGVLLHALVESPFEIEDRDAVAAYLAAWLGTADVPIALTEAAPRTDTKDTPHA
jgi:hypothetical protein